jgi:hypothetical protein
LEPAIQRGGLEILGERFAGVRGDVLSSLDRLQQRFALLAVRDPGELLDLFAGGPALLEMVEEAHGSPRSRVDIVGRDH